MIWLIVRSRNELALAKLAAAAAEIPFVELTDSVEMQAGSIPVSTMHLAKIQSGCRDGL